MIRYLRIALMGVATLTATVGPALAAEVTMRLRGSDLTFTGTVISFDGTVYRLETEQFGTVNLNLKKFECISGACSATGTSPAATAAGPDFGIHGSRSIGSNLMPRLLGAYAQSVNARAAVRVSSNSGETKIELTDSQGKKISTVDLVAQSSNAAFSALAKRQAPIGMSSRPINDEEAKLLPSVKEHFLAHDGLLAIVSPQNPMSEISVEQLASVFAGKVSNWSQLGQAPGRINVYGRNKETGTLDTFKSLVFGPAGGQIAPNAKQFKSDAEISDSVARDPRGIGFTSFAYKGKAKALSISYACGITYAPSVFNIKSEEYPLSRYLLLYSSSNSLGGHAQRFLQYARSGQAQNVISEAGFINRSLLYLPFKSQGNRIIQALDVPSDNFDLALMKKLIKEIGHLSRLSVTFRFRSGSFALDPKSQEKVAQLAALLSSDQMRGKEMLLLGFSDTAGAFDQNRDLSVVRARQVKQELLRVGGGRIDQAQLQERGYGELLPVGCNDNPFGRARNRRVEVWFKAPAAPLPQMVDTTAPAPQTRATIAPPSPNNQALTASTEDQKTQLKKQFREFLKWKKSRRGEVWFKAPAAPLPQMVDTTAPAPQTKATIAPPSPNNQAPTASTEDQKTPLEKQFREFLKWKKSRQN